MLQCFKVRSDLLGETGKMMNMKIWSHGLSQSISDSIVNHTVVVSVLCVTLDQTVSICL